MFINFNFSKSSKEINGDIQYQINLIKYLKNNHYKICEGNFGFNTILSKLTLLLGKILIKNFSFNNFFNILNTLIYRNFNYSFKKNYDIIFSHYFFPFLKKKKIIRKKNLSFLLEIFSKLVNKYNNIYLLIVGDGEERSFLEKKYNNFSKNIKFLGFANQKEISNFYSISNIFIMPSSYEPWGLSVNEAMIFQNALLLSSNVGSGYDLLKHNKNGFFFKNNCSHDLESKIQKLLSNKKKLTKMQKESKKIISKWSINYSKNYFMNIINSF